MEELELAGGHAHLELDGEWSPPSAAVGAGPLLPGPRLVAAPVEEVGLLPTARPAHVDQPVTAELPTERADRV